MFFRRTQQWPIWYLAKYLPSVKFVGVIRVSSSIILTSPMIISASRRTDIPAFYAEWLVNRLREGYCTVPNPFNRNQVSRISLRPEDVDAIVFWTRNPRPLMPYLDELDSCGYRYYFQFTILGYPRQIDAHSPAIEVAVKTLIELAKRIGPNRVIWRYDPIVFSELTSPAFHEENFQRLSVSLKGSTRRVVVSIVDNYRKIEKRLKVLEGTKAAMRPCSAENFCPENLGPLMQRLAELAQKADMEIVSCAEEIDLRPFGILPGKCVDARVLAEAFGIQVSAVKDSGQRLACGCVASRDIGMYESCLFGCQYCYATKNFEQAKANFESHDPKATSLLCDRSHCL